MKKVSRADIYAVWGKPPPILNGLSKAQSIALKRYVDEIVGRVYRIAYDNGAVEGFCKVSMIAANELRIQRDWMLKSNR